MDFLQATYKTKRHNAAKTLDSMRSWYYFDRPKNLLFRDLFAELEPPKNLRSLLGLGLKFFPFHDLPTTILPKPYDTLRKNSILKHTTM